MGCFLSLACDCPCFRLWRAHVIVIPVPLSTSTVLCLSQSPRLPHSASSGGKRVLSQLPRQPVLACQKHIHLLRQMHFRHPAPILHTPTQALHLRHEPLCRSHGSLFVYNIYLVYSLGRINTIIGSVLSMLA